MHRSIAGSAVAIVVSAAATPAVSMAQRAATSPDSIQTSAATVRFSVLDSVFERPIQGARVELADGSWLAYSDQNGRVRFNGVPVGARRIRVRAIGYHPVDRLVVIRAVIATDSTDRLIDLAPVAAVLETQHTVATRADADADGGAFETRRRMGIGHFLTSRDFDGQEGRSIGQIVAEHVPGVRGDERLSSTRGTGRCLLDTYVDGRYVHAPFSLSEIPLFDVAGVEVYSATNIPPQFNNPAVASGRLTGGSVDGSPDCGVLLIWLRRY